MTCRICKRGGCTESFHSLEEQERFADDRVVHGQNCDCCAAHGVDSEDNDDE